MARTAALEILNRRITACRACPRLVAHREHMAVEKRAAFRDQTYWGRPVPNLLPPDPNAARLLIVGLAPAAHGANRTGRMFTGDRSGDFLFAALHATGFANQPHATAIGDGFELRDLVITAACHCAPPDNKPTTEELATCRPFLTDTIDALPRLRAILTLGRVGHDAVLREYLDRGWIARRSTHPFRHGVAYTFDHHAPALLACYHPSQHNTFTGRLTPAMLRGVLEQARAIIEAEEPRSP